MNKSLEHFHIGPNLGANQDKFKDLTLKIGGCAIVTVCDTFIVMVRNGFASSLIPINKSNITMVDYEDFAHKVKPYLHPRLTGIYQLETYIKGVNKYLKEQTNHINHIHISSVPGETDEDIAANKLKQQIDRGIPAVFLLLLHTDKDFSDYEWHWFLINGYDEAGNELKVQLLTYGETRWVDFHRLWNTGKPLRGGMVFFQSEEPSKETNNRLFS